jgi:vacuolar protein sorting-associated protein 35
MDALKHCSGMLAELRTSVLSPKHYYELYMAIFDNLRFMTTYLADAHTSNRHHLADLYELVQYAGNIIPRLYLMITVGSVYMAMPDAPVREIMKDMLEMCRGVQHPTRGLFLRHYLSGMTKDHLPVSEEESSSGCLKDSIQFTLINFTEMNKLWVRLQHQGHSRDRERRELERKELRTLVGSNLVRLATLEGIDLSTYSTLILPDVLEQIINCKDVLAQEYLMEAVIQVFQDDFHLRTLSPFLSAVAQLNPRVSPKSIYISLIDRLAAYASREADSQNENQEESEDKAAVSRGIPDDVKLFEVFWAQVVELVKARPDIPLHDITALQVSLINLSLNCYPSNLEYVDQVLDYALNLDPAAHTGDNVATEDNLLQLLLAPIRIYPNALTVLSLVHYKSLFDSQPYSTRRSVGLALVSALLKQNQYISEPSECEGVFHLVSVLAKDQPDGGPHHSNTFGRTSSKLAGRGQSLRGVNGDNDEDFVNEQHQLAKLIHLVYTDDKDQMFRLLNIVRRELSEGGIRVQYTFPSIVSSCLKLARSYLPKPESEDDTWYNRSSELFRFVHQTISILYSKAECHDLAFKLYLNAGLACDELGIQTLGYEFFVQALTIYEECISESNVQLQAIHLLIGTLHSTRDFDTDNYDALTTKCVMHSGKLLKKHDQCRALYHSAHLFWPVESVPQVYQPESDQPAIPAQTNIVTQRPVEHHRDAKRAMDTLNRALKVAHSVIDPVKSIELLVEILNRYFYFFENQCPSIEPSHINGLIDLIKNNYASLSESQPQSLDGTNSTDYLASLLKFFQGSLDYVQTKSKSNTDSSIAYDQLKLDSSIA